MEAKVKHRIIGIVIITAALVAIALPLLFSDNEVINTAKVQPLPDQASINTVQTIQNESQAAVTPIASAQASSHTEAVVTVQPSTTVSAQASAQPLVQQPEVKTQSTEAIPSQMPSPIATKAETTAPVQTPASPAPVKKIAKVKTVVAAPKVKSIASKAPFKLVKPVVAKAHFKMTAHAKRVAWVVQMGSFKNKENARHLTDRLRAAGFKAFTYTAKSGLRGSIRVYVGPEYKQARASVLSNKLAQKTKIQGIILPYQPLVLDNQQNA